jgi:hypothetical protein
MNTPELPSARCAYREMLTLAIRADPSEVPELLPCQMQVGAFTCQAVVYLRPSLLADNENMQSKTTTDLRPDAGPCLDRLPPEDAEDMLKALRKALDPDNEAE